VRFLRGPRTAAERARRLRIAQYVALGAVVVVAIAFFFVFAVPDRIEQIVFVHSLRTGASRAEVAALAARVGHRLVNATDGVASVEFAQARTSCSERATRIVIFFDRNDRVRNWNTLGEQVVCN